MRYVKHNMQTVAWRNYAYFIPRTVKPCPSGRGYKARVDKIYSNNLTAN